MLFARVEADPATARLFVALADGDHLPIKRGPSSSRRAATAARDAGLRRVRRDRFGGQSDRGAAKSMMTKINLYAGQRLKIDIAAGTMPSDDLEAITFRAKVCGLRPLTVENLRKIISG